MTDTSDHRPAQSLAVCRLCGAYCGIVVHTVGTTVVKVRGDTSHPVSRGYTCGKGRAIPEFHHHPDRLDHPTVDGQVTSWTHCLDDAARRLRTVIDQHGPGAVAGYSGMGTFGDRAGMTAYLGLLALLGTPQRYTAASVDIFPLWKTYELVMGYPKEANPSWEPEDSPQLCIAFGQNFVVAHGYASALLTNPVQRVREFRARGGALWVLDPRRTETAELADRHLPLRPDSDAVVLAWLVREVLREGASEAELATSTMPEDLERLRAGVEPFTLAVASERSQLPEADLEALLAAIRRSGKVACISGSGLTFGRHAMLAEWLRLVLMIITGSMDAPRGMRFPTGVVDPLHEREAWSPAPPQGTGGPGPTTHPELSTFLGEYPCVALVDEIEAGNVKALIVNGGNPLTAFPNPERTAAALRSLDVLIVLDVLDKPLPRMATHVLPAADIIEHADIVTREHASYSPAVVPPVAERRPSWWAFAQLGRRLGLPVLEGIDIDQCSDEEVLRTLMGSAKSVDEVYAAGTHGVHAPRRDGWFRAAALPDGYWRIAPPMLAERLPALLAEHTQPHTFRLVSRRQPGSMNSVNYGLAPGKGRPEYPDMAMHPHDVDRLQLEEGSVVVVSNRNGLVTARVRPDVRVAQGVVSLTHGWHEPNVNHLVAGDQDIDPLSGQPRMSGVEVTVALAPPGTAAVVDARPAVTLPAEVEPPARLG